MPTLRDIACDVFVFRTRRQPGISLGTWKTTRSSVIDVSYAAKALLLMTSRVVAYTIPAHMSLDITLLSPYSLHSGKHYLEILILQYCPVLCKMLCIYMHSIKGSSPLDENHATH